MLILRVSMSSSIDSRLTCVGTRSRQTSIHDPSPQPVSQERGAGEPVGLHHGPSLRRRRGGGERKKIKTRQWSCHLLRPGSPRLRRLLPRCAHSSSNSRRGCCACLRCLRVPRCAVPRGVWSRPPPRRRSQAGLGRCPTGSLRWQPLRNAKKIPPPPGRAGSRDKMVPFWTRAAVARWQGQDSGGPGPDEGAGPTGGRLELAGARQPAGSRAGRCSRRQRTHPHTHTRALAAAAAAAGGGWRRLVH